MMQKAKWRGGLVDWVIDDKAFISVVFTWRLAAAYSLALWHKEMGKRVIVGGPALHSKKDYFGDIAEYSNEDHFAIYQHNPMATMASRGCPVDCWFCIVPKIEGTEFTLIPDFKVRPILCDNNLSALPVEYQEHIISRYEKTEIPLLDANSGFAPLSFDRDTYHRWKRINKGPWRLAYDSPEDREPIRRALNILKDEPANKKMIYVLIGNQPIDQCLRRIQEVIEWGGEPHVQPFIPLNTMEKTPSVRYDWSRRTLADMARWANRRVWRYGTFQEYLGPVKSKVLNDRQETLRI